MFGFFIKVVLFLVLAVGLQAQSGFSQKHLVSVSTDSSIEIEFDLPIVAKSVKKHTIVLKSVNKKSKNKRVKGRTTLKDERTLLFTPSEDLKSGEYKLKVNPLKLQDFPSSAKDLHGFKRFAYKMCSFFYDDIKRCPLCKYICSIKTKRIKSIFSVEDNKPKVVSLSLDKSDIELNENNQTTINVSATYDDNSSVDVTNDVEWIMSNNSVVSISKNTITPTNEGITTLEAKYNNQTSTKITITVFKEVNGYKLPPEPDEKLNNSTLLGIDVNDNGIRDDVERKVILTYKEPIKIELMMSYSKVGQEILANPVGGAIENQKKISKIGDCSMYLKRQKQRPSNRFDFYENNVYNTKQRVRAYLDYNLALSGGVYGSSPADWNAQACDFDVEQMLKDVK